MFWSDYTDTEGATKKTKEQIAREKAGVGGSIIRVKKQAAPGSLSRATSLTAA
jgi:hypothetical protein